MTTRLSAIGLLSSLLVMGAACSSDSSSSSSSTTLLTDTLGNVFSVSCSSFCTLTPKDTNVKPVSCDTESGGTDTFVLVFGTQILTVQALLVPSYGYISLNGAEPARPVACTTDADCAPGLLSAAYTCQSGICQYTTSSTSLQTTDVIALCQADIPWPSACPYVTNPLFASRMAEVAALCGSKTACSSVPSDCHQPTATTTVTPLDAGTVTVSGADTLDGATGASLDGGAVGSLDGGI